MAEQEAKPISDKTKWYRAHNSPELREKMNESRRAYYRRNRELEAARAKARYLARKEAMILAGMWHEEEAKS